MAANGYEFTEEKSELNIKYLFISKGKKDVVKAIDYTFVGQLHQQQQIFNLGFGDYDIDTDTIDDSVNSENGDVYAVFHTVLNSIPKFFETYSDAAIIVQGSDSGKDFIDKCKPTCKKSCDNQNTCKNQNRRISVYRNYVNKGFDTLSKEYTFYGGVRNMNNRIEIEAYIVEKKYDSVLVVKKNK